MVIAQDSDGLIKPRLFIKRIDENNTRIFTVLEVDGTEEEVQIWPKLPANGNSMI